jgi:hypothetical protein
MKVWALTKRQLIDVECEKSWTFLGEYERRSMEEIGYIYESSEAVCSNEEERREEEAKKIGCLLCARWTSHVRLFLTLIHSLFAFSTRVSAE